MTVDTDADWQPEADRQPDAEQQPDADRRPDAVETPSQPPRPSGTEPDEWRFGAYPRLVEDTDGCPR